VARVGVEGCVFFAGVEAEEAALHALCERTCQQSGPQLNLSYHDDEVAKGSKLSLAGSLEHTNSIHGFVATPTHFNPSCVFASSSTCFRAARFGWNSGTASTSASFMPSPAYSVGRIHSTPAWAAASMSFVCSPMAMKPRAKMAASMPWNAVDRKEASE
jgi:hypothetical protein